MLIPDLTITAADRDTVRWHGCTDSAIVGFKLVAAQTTDFLLEALLKGGENFDILLVAVGENTNPTWLKARIADELFDRDELSRAERCGWPN